MGSQALQCAVFSFLGALSATAGLRAGAAARTITPAIDAARPVYLAGFSNNRIATGIHDELYSRCLALSAKQTVVLCSVDSIGLFFEDVARIRAGVTQKWSKGAVSVIVAATHSHQTPDTMGLWGPGPEVSGIDEGYNATIVNRTIEAAVAALTVMKSAKAIPAHVPANHLTQFLHDTRPPVIHDSEVNILRLTRSNGRGIATLVNWANHPEALGSKNTLISADYVEALRRDTESRLGGVTVFLNGALGGMQSPLGARFRDPRTESVAEPDTFRFAEVIGNRVADEVVNALRNASPAAIGEIRYAEKLVRIPVANQRFQAAVKAGLFKGRKLAVADGAAEAPVGFLRMSHRGKPVVEAIAIPGELYPELSVGGIQRYPGADFPGAAEEPPLKPMLKAKMKMLFGLANDEIGYIIPKAEWDEKEPYLQNSPKRWYGEVNSAGPEAAPVIADAVKELVEKR